jgi:hypothetical protein
MVGEAVGEVEEVEEEVVRLHGVEEVVEVVVEEVVEEVVRKVGLMVARPEFRLWVLHEMVLHRKVVLRQKVVLRRRVVLLQKVDLPPVVLPMGVLLVGAEKWVELLLGPKCFE